MTETRTAQQIWKAALGELQIQVNKSNYRTWLEKTTGLSYQDNQFVIGVANTFVAEYLDKSQRSLIEKVLTGLIHREVQVRFQVDSNSPSSSSSYGRRERTNPAQQTSLPLFNPKYTFDSDRKAGHRTVDSVKRPSGSPSHRSRGSPCCRARRNSCSTVRPLPCGSTRPAQPARLRSGSLNRPTTS
ncbi:MAG: hypothetical protein HYY80_04815 [Chloroflexi bacterium]|nr:hypothetical protein [Chloroflexota bacterium]